MAGIFWTQITFHARYHVPEQLIFSFQIMFGQNIHLAGISNQENVPEQALTNHRVFSHTSDGREKINSKLGDRVALKVHILITSCLRQSLRGSFLKAMRSMLLNSEAAAHTYLTVGGFEIRKGKEVRGHDLEKPKGRKRKP